MADIIDVNIGDQVLEVYWQDEVELNLYMNLMYIKSGQKEIQVYVDNVSKPEINSYIETEAKPIVSEVVSQIAEPTVNEYLETVTKPSIDEYVADNVKPYADSAKDSAAKAKTSETNAKASELAAASSAGGASAAAVTATEAKDYTAKVLTDDNLKTVGQDLQSADSNIKTVATNIVNVNTVAKNIDNVKEAVQSANDAKLWAVGTKTEKPEGSSKYWAEQAKNAVKTPDATETVKGIVRLATSNEVTAGINDSAAITPLKLKSKLDTKQDKSTAVNYNNISNCITEIPQDIKLELNNGTLTLKAGSKLYIPNGFESDGTTKKFDTKIIESDIIFSALNYSTNLHIISLLSSNLIQALMTETQQFSGDTAPTPTNVYAFWYDTTNNIVKYTIDNGSTWTESCSLPLGLISIEKNKGITSIDQVFNGFGYIGSTIFALPGVKGLIPNGRNADGSLKNIEFTIDKVSITTNGGSSDTRNIVLYTSGDIDHPELSGYLYDENFLWIMNYNGSGYFKGDRMCVGPVEYSSGKVISFTPKTVFHALDYNDKSTISGWSMPSFRYIDLTLGASGTSYTAPANGWVYIAKVGGSSNAYVNLTNMENGLGLIVHVPASSNVCKCFIPVKKGDVFKVEYTASGTHTFRFIYAEGENS